MASFAVPFIFMIVSATSFSLLINKRIIDCIAPVFLIQIILCIASAILFRSFSLGLVISSALWIIGFVFALLQKKKIQTRALIQDYVLILLLYMAVFTLNRGKVFSEWDEFSHWGIFVKEMLRLDNLYCTSQASMAHKDYVPAISVFEAVWCKLSMGYSEPNTYRGIQMLQASMLFPLVTFSGDRKEGNKEVFKRVLLTIIVFGIPLYFGQFYHTLMKDLVLGLLIYYCMFIIISDKGKYYKAFLLTISLMVLVLTKTTAVVFFPMILIFYVVYESKFHQRIREFVFQIAVVSCAPIALWIAVNGYIETYVKSFGDAQSLSGFRLSTVFEIIFGAGNPWSEEVSKAFVKSLFFKGVVYRIPYVLFVGGCCFLLFVLSRYISDEIVRKKIMLINLWICLAGAAYAVIMNVLYLVAFGEYEASILASYERYMSTFLLAIAFIVIATYVVFYSEKLFSVLVISAAFVLEDLLIFVDLNQILPGTITGEVAHHTYISNDINEHVPLEDSTYILDCGTNGEIPTKIRYYCSPRDIEFGSIGKKRNSEDVWSRDCTDKELIELLECYDWMYVLNADDVFKEQYEDCIVSDYSIENGRLYKIYIRDGKIYLQ